MLTVVLTFILKTHVKEFKNRNYVLKNHNFYLFKKWNAQLIKKILSILTNALKTRVSIYLC